jgi:uncharacterized protein
MRPRQPIVATNVALLALAACAAAAAQAPSADAVIEKSFRATRVADATADVTFVLSEPNGRVRVMTAMTRTKLAANGTDNMRIVWFLSPGDVRGIATLMVEHRDSGSDILVYLPAEKKIRRLDPANNDVSYVGTDFSYADLIGFKPHAWLHRLSRQEELNGHQDYVIVSVPATRVALPRGGYAKRMEWIRADNYVMEKAQLYDVGDKLLKIIVAGNIRPVDPAKTRWQAMRLEARNMLTGRTTVIKFENYSAAVGLSAKQFSERALEHGP